MADKGHPGVKSLLARFENSQQSAPSPPPRDRSPAGSDTMSKVRASFIAVEGGSQSSPVLGLRRISPHSETPSSPSRVKSFSSEDLDSSVKSYGSSPQTSNGFGSAQRVNEAEKKDAIRETFEPKGKEKAEEMTSANKENQPAPTSSATAPGLLTGKSTKIVSKKPSNVHIGKSSLTIKPASQASPKTSTQPRTSTSASKPENEKPTKTTRAPRPSTNTNRHDAPKAPVHKPSRTALATAAKTATRSSRASTPAREITKSAARTSDARSSSTVRPARLPASATTPSLASAAKLSAPGGATSTLSRKPSSLKNTSNAVRQRATTPTASSVRKQASRTPPKQSGSRSHSRASTATKAVDEGFLARMMRPTASSANKAHEKVEVKSPPRPNAARPLRSVPSKLDTRPNHPMKEKIATETLDKKRLPAEPADTHRKVQEQKAAIVQEEFPEQSAPEVSVEPPSQSPEPVVDVKQSHELIVESLVESAADPVVEPIEPVEPAGSHCNDEAGDAHAVPTEDTATESVVQSPTSTTADEQDELTEAPAKPVSEVLNEQVSSPVEQIDGETIETPNTDIADATEPIETAELVEESESAPGVSREKEPENLRDIPVETHLKPDEVDIDINKLTLNENDSSS